MLDSLIFPLFSSQHQGCQFGVCETKFWNSVFFFFFLKIEKARQNLAFFSRKGLTLTKYFMSCIFITNLFWREYVRQRNYGERKYFRRLEVIDVSDELTSILCLVMHVLWLLSGFFGTRSRCFFWRRQAGYPGLHFASSKESQEKTWPLREGSRLAVWDARVKYFPHSLSDRKD